jgi:hypothetical protein
METALRWAPEITHATTSRRQVTEDWTILGCLASNPFRTSA